MAKQATAAATVTQHAVVVIVSRDIETAAQDEGIQTYDEILRRAEAYLSSRQPDATLRTGPAVTDAPDATTPVKLGAVLADGRRIVIDVRLVPHMLDSGPEVDAWFDAVTPAADLVLYNGHAGLGTNIRTLSQKGSFAPGKYVVWAVNGCDTFAYLDRTLAARRATLNPDDPSGTRYMDQVSNVMPSYFKTAPRVRDDVPRRRGERRGRGRHAEVVRGAPREGRPGAGRGGDGRGGQHVRPTDPPRVVAFDVDVGIRGCARRWGSAPGGTPPSGRRPAPDVRRVHDGSDAPPADASGTLVLTLVLIGVGRVRKRRVAHPSLRSAARGRTPGSAS